MSQVAKEKAEKEEAEADVPDPSVRSICLARETARTSAVYESSAA